MRLIDSHVHLEQISNLNQALENAKSAGIEGVIAVGVDSASNKKTLELSRFNHSVKIFPALGLHPGDIITQEIDSTINFIESNIKNLVAIGEIGLDFWYKEAKKLDKKEEQMVVFKRQLLIAKKNNLPASIHSRGAWKECIAICKDLSIEKAIFHWYSGPIDILRLILDTGYSISVTPALEYSRQHQEAAVFAPIDRILIETDSPVIFHSKPPHPALKGEAFRVGRSGCGGKDGDYESTPCDCVKSLKYLAQIKSLNEDTLAQKIFDNTLNFFRISLL